VGIGAASQVHGTNPQFLLEKIVRLKIYEDPYWKEHCFALTAETIVDEGARARTSTPPATAGREAPGADLTGCRAAIKLKCIGGTYGGNRRPTPFLCLVRHRSSLLLLLLRATDCHTLHRRRLSCSRSRRRRKSSSSSFSTKTTSQRGGPLVRATHRELGHRYVRLLGAFYMRLTGKPVETYQYLEPLLNDYRKVRYLNAMGSTLPWLGCGISQRGSRARPQSMRLRTWMR
jgi:pre-mRNA-splicing factor 38A